MRSMNSSPAPLDDRQRVGDTDRERVANTLLAAMTEGRLTAAELDERLTDAYAATTVADLGVLVADLGHDTDTVLAPRAAESAPDTRDDRINFRPGSHVSVAILGSVERTGGWVAPWVHTSFCYLGNITIDLREARFSRPSCTIVALAIFGTIRIIVPPDVTVRTAGLGLIGNFTGTSAHPSPDAPLVRVTGIALLGEVVVDVQPRRGTQLEES